MHTGHCILFDLMNKWIKLRVTKASQYTGKDLNEYRASESKHVGAICYNYIDNSSLLTQNCKGFY